MRAAGLALAILLSTGSAAAQTTSFSLSPMITDHAVLQRGRPLVIEGQGAPREPVVVTLGNVSARGKADAQGRWRVTLPAQAAGGGNDLIATGRGGRSARANDILIGDVWLCSGQSNMEWAVRQSLNADNERARMPSPRIRLLKVEHASNTVPQTAFASPVAWSVATADSVSNFSGACYFMARDLHERTGVPFGLIQSTWGGSNIEAWVPPAALGALPGYADALAINKLFATDRPTAELRMAGLWQDWWQARAGKDSAPWASDAGLDWQPVPQPFRDWKTWGLPALADYNGMVWFDRTVTLTPEQAAQGAAFETGQIDEIDQSWINGKPVGNSFGWATERAYTLPPGTLRAGENRIVMNIYSAWGLGGMFGPAEHIALKLTDGTRIPIGDGWRYALPKQVVPAPPAAPWYAIGGKTSLYNAMIAPMGSTAIAGVAWYQGESNTGNAGEYVALLDAMKRGWRAQFGAQTPFLIVGLANFGMPATAPVESGWAALRDAQRRSTAADPRAALVPALDIGEPTDIHPANKQVLGLRLARAARGLVYGEKIAPSGPQVESATRETAGVRVRFTGVTGALVARSDARPIAFELCGPDGGSCRFAEAQIDGSTVIVRGGNLPSATRVRYCWSDAPVCNLYDTDGLPAGPFEQPIG